MYLVLMILFLPLFCRVIFPVLYSYEYCTAILREKRKSGVYENKAMMGIFGSKEGQVTGA